MADEPPTSGSYQEGEKSGSNISSKRFSKCELRSSIPKPTAQYVRSREKERAMSCSSSHSQPVHYSKIPTFHSVDRGKTCASLQYRGSTTIPAPGFSRPPKFNIAPSPRPKPSVRPKSASLIKNPYSNIKAKVNSQLTPAPKSVKSQFHPVSVVAMKPCSPGKTLCSVASSTTYQSAEEKPLSEEELHDKQRQLLSIYNELRKLQPARDLQPLEREICRLMQTKTLSHLECISRENSSFLSEGSPEFLSTFEKQMQNVTELWLMLVCNIVSVKASIGNTSLSRLALPDPTLDLREEINKFLSCLPTEGDPLHTKLRQIEEEQLKAMTVVMHSVMALFKQHEDLKDQHFRLEKTQDQIHFELKEEIAILGTENKELDNKYALAVEKYNLEKAKTEQQEKQKLTISRELIEVKKVQKCWEGRVMEWESRVKKLEAGVRSLDVAVRNKEVTAEREAKQHRDLLNKYNEAKKTIESLNTELTKSKDAQKCLEDLNKELQDKITVTQAAMNETLQKRNELLEALAAKKTKLNEAEVELDLIKTYISNSTETNRDAHDITSRVLVEDLTKDLQQKNLQIQELNKKLENMEQTLKEKSAREDLLAKQVVELQKQPHESIIALKGQVKELNYMVKDLTEEKTEMEKIVAQKTLELDQRDLLMQEHSQILKARDELIPMIQDKQRKEKECIERLSAVVFEHRKTYSDQEEGFGYDRQNAYESMKALERRYSVDSNMMEKELSFRQEKMSELFNLLEHKQMEMMRLERRLRELQGVHREKELMEREREARISSLQRELTDRRANKPRGFFSLFSGQDVPSY